MKSTKTRKKPRNQFEKDLDKQIAKSGIEYEYEGIKLSYTIEGNYTPDWSLKNGIIIEAKGFFRAEAMRKMVAVKKAHPHLDIRFVFYSKDGKLTKKLKQYIKFADKYGFPYAIGSIPEEWLR